MTTAEQPKTSEAAQQEANDAMIGRHCPATTTEELRVQYDEMRHHMEILSKAIGAMQNWGTQIGLDTHVGGPITAEQ